MLEEPQKEKEWMITTLVVVYRAGRRHCVISFIVMIMKINKLFSYYPSFVFAQVIFWVTTIY